MNRFLLVPLLAACAVAAAQAQPAADPGQDPAQVAAERERIAAERRQVEDTFAAAQKACFQKFAVTGCMDEAKARRRDALADLRRQEIALNDAQRRAKTAEQLRSLEQRQADHERKAKQAETDGAAKAQAREERGAEKAAKARQAASAAADRAKPKAAKPEREPPDSEASREAYDRRVRQADQHRADVQRRAASAKKDIKPLPVPP